MKNSVSPGVVAAIAVVVVLVLGFFAWKTFRPPTANSGKNPYEGHSAPALSGSGGNPGQGGRPGGYGGMPGSGGAPMPPGQ